MTTLVLSNIPPQIKLKENRRWRPFKRQLLCKTGHVSKSPPVPEELPLPFILINSTSFKARQTKANLLYLLYFEAESQHYRLLGLERIAI